jgi:hypothetical protein
MAEFVQVFNGGRVTHPPKNLFFGYIIRQHFNICCGPAATTYYQNFVSLLHLNKNVLPGLFGRTNVIDFLMLGMCRFQMCECADLARHLHIH